MDFVRHSELWDLRQTQFRWPSKLSPGSSAFADEVDNFNIRHLQLYKSMYFNNDQYCLILLYITVIHYIFEIFFMGH